MSPIKKSSLFEFAARRARTRAEYLGWVLARFMEVERKTDQELADLLSISVYDLNRIALCLRPRNASFATDLSQIARKFGVNAVDLAGVIRHVEVIEGMRDESHEESIDQLGLMMAARARRKKPKASGRRKKDDPRST